MKDSRPNFFLTKMFHHGKSVSNAALLGLVLAFGTSCSAGGNLPTTPLLGGGAGGLAGYWIGDSLADPGRENAGRAIGAGLGIVSGAVAGGLVERNSEEQRRRALPTKRVKETQDRTLDIEIDRARRELDDGLNYGRSETKSYEERYRDSESNTPYQRSY